MLEAISGSLAMATFSLDGEILSANEQFLGMMGYKLEEIVGKHHRIFVDPSYAESDDYRHFWSNLSQGTSQTAEIKRITKSGREIWLQATYMPVKDAEGKEVRILKVATDISSAKQASDGNADMMAGVERAMAIVEFDPDGTVLSANQNFLDLTGYTLEELAGKHHSIFVDEKDVKAEAYAAHWQDLRSGKILQGRYRRIGKNGEDLWLQATYTPIYNSKGELIKIVKFAYDVTMAVHQSHELEHALEAAHQAKELEIALAKAQEAERARRDMDLAIQELSTPVTPIWDQILLLPLVGILDSMRAASIMTKSLQMIAQTRAKIFILDISGVATVDTAVANQLIKITKATQLMGCEAIISGLSPAVARTIVELGVNVGEIRTKATLRDALESALTGLGNPIGHWTPQDRLATAGIH